MKTFKEFLIEGKEATDYESYITVAFNGGISKDSTTLKNNRLTPEDYKPREQNAIKIAKIIKKHTKANGEMTQYGASAGKLVSWWEGADTPKTDMYVNNVRISLKEAGGSQLLSAKQGEARSTFKAALLYLDKKNISAEKLAHKITEAMEEIVVPKAKITIGEFTKKAKAGDSFDDSDLNEIKQRFLAANDIKTSLTKELNEYFMRDPEFKKWFAYEAATGETKFSGEGKNGKSIANWVVKFSSGDGTVREIEKISLGYGKPGQIINSLAKKMKFRISWKTPTSKGAKTYLSLRGDIKEHVESQPNLFEMLNNEISSFFSNSMINEGFMDVVSKVKNFIVNLFKKVKNAILSVAKQGYRSLISFLGFGFNAVNVSVGNLSF